VRETIPLEKYQASPEIYTQEQNYDIKKVKLKTIAYYNFLAVDYSVIYTDNLPFEEIEVGTPASQSNVETYNLTDDNKINKTQLFSYKEYLKKSIKLLSEKQYGNVINNFNVILKHYPNDVNAQFYNGFAHYNLKKYPKAITFF
jgi:TolA-binding protein